jgi:predicted phosphodiesterase
MPKIIVPENTSIYAIGDIHEHSEHFFSLLKKIKPNQNNWIVSVGDVYHKGYGRAAAEIITQELMNLSKNGFGFAVRGNHELQEIKICQKLNKTTKYVAWWAKQPLSYSFIFPSNFRLTVVHGGITPKMTEQDLENNQNLVYIRTIGEDGEYVKYTYDKISRKLIPTKPGIQWNEVYDGRFGYICAGHDEQESGEPKLFKHSSNVDTAVPFTGKLTAQKFTNDGPGEFISVIDTPFKPELDAR